MATAEITPMIDVASPVDASTDAEIPSLDATPDPEVPAVETPASENEGGAETKTDDKATAEKAAADLAAATTPAKMAAALQEMKKADPSMAKALYDHVKSNLQTQKFLRSEGVKSFEELKTKLSTPDKATEEFRQSVEATDQMLYSGDLNTLTSNIFEGLEANLGDAAPARLSELTESLLDKINEVDGDGATRIKRAAFLAASESSGLISSLNKLNTHLASGNVEAAKTLLGAIGKFFSEEFKQRGDIAAKATAAKETATKASTTLKTMQTELRTSVSKATNDVMGGFLRPFLTAQLKGVPRTELVKAAQEVQSDLDKALSSDNAWRELMGPKWSGLKTKNDSAAMLKLFEDKLKTNDFGKKIVETTLKRLFPAKFSAQATAKAPASTKVMLGGKQATCFTVKARPENLLRGDLQYAGRVYTAADISLLQVKGMGFVPSSSGKGIVLVSWRQK